MRFDGVDGPRPLPPGLAERISAAITAGPLAGVEGPRPVPPGVRAAVEGTLVTAAVTGSRGNSPRIPRAVASGSMNARWTRLIGAAAAFVLVAGVAAALAAGPDEPTQAPTAALGTTTTSSTTTTAPAAVVGGDPVPPPTTAPTEIVPLAGSEAVVATLTPYQSCDELLTEIRAEAVERVGPYGLEGSGPIWVSGGRGGPARGEVGTGTGDAGTGGGDSPPAPAPATGSAATSGGVSTSNVQEPGVDEADQTKTDGRALYSLVNGAVEVVDLTTTPPTYLTRLALPAQQYASALLLEGLTLVVVSSGPSAAVVSSPSQPSPAVTTLTAFDVSDPAAPDVVGSGEVEGSYISSRSSDGRLRVVTSDGPHLAFVYPSGPDAEAAALEQNRRVVAEAPVEAWIGNRPCESVGRPDEFSGFDLTTVYSVATDASVAESATVQGGGQLVYATADDLYVATVRYDWLQPARDGSQPPADVRTEIHRFATAAGGRPEYLASGAVPGYLMNQFAMSEHDGNLRVASTEDPFATIDQTERPSSGTVTVLARSDRKLVPIGQLRDLGVGERVFGVRFVGTLGYVVTFLQIDPLHVIDLADPTNPVLRGVLELTGNSAYLHPIADGRLLGIGASASPEGIRTGLQATLFDVANPDAPSIVGQVQVPNGYSPVEGDHLAFLWWAPRSLAVVPYSSCCDSSPAGGEAGALLLVADGDGLRELGRLLRPDGVMRAVVVGDVIYTVGFQGVAAVGLENLDDRGFAAFPQPPQPGPYPEPQPVN